MMTNDPGRRKRLLLVGAGHAHLFSFARIERFLRGGIDVTVISSAPLRFFGTGPEVLGDSDGMKELTVDVRALVERGGGRFLEGRVASVHPQEHCVRTESGEELFFDALSLNIGSEIPSALLGGSPGRVFAVRSISSLLELRRRILALPPGAKPHLAVAGGGPSGCEAAANVYELSRRHGRSLRITLTTGAAGLLPYFPLKARQLVAAELQTIGVEVSERRTTLVSGDTLVYSDGSTGDADFLVVATGARPSKVLTESGLEVDDEGAVIVDEYLQSLSAKGVFGGGDCVAFQPMELERSASHALRQGRVLFANLLAYLSGEPMRPFIPKKEPLTILNLGRTGLLVRKPFVARGRFALLLKRWIDRRIVKEFQSPSEEKS